MADDWERDEKAVDCKRHMLEKEIGCDVNFIVGPDDGATEIVRAHKCILMARSPVFFAMFDGELAETKGAIRVVDIESDVFKKILRYIYCDLVEHLESRDVSSQMYAADKYNLSGLASKCEDWMDQNIQAENVCPIWECADRHQREALSTKARAYILQNPADVLSFPSFLDLPQRLLKALLSSDELDAEEDAIYEACLNWAKHQCRETKADVTGPAIRQALGDCLHLVRFPLLKSEVFVDLMAKCPGVLTNDEERSVLTYNVNKNHGTVFPSSPRNALHCVHRFNSVCASRVWSCQNGKPDAISFKCDTEIFIKGIAVYGRHQSQMERLDPLKVILIPGYFIAKRIIANIEEKDRLQPHKIEIKILGEDDNTVYKQTEESFQSSGQHDPMPIFFKEEVKILPDKEYTIIQQVWCRTLYCGADGKRQISSGNVKFEFSKSALSKNETNIEEGQIPAIFFMTISRSLEVCKTPLLFSP